MIEDGGIDAAEVGVVLEIAIIESIKAGMIADEASLHFAADQQGVLMAHQQLPVECDGGPTGAIHQTIMQGLPTSAGIGANLRNIFRRDAARKILFDGLVLTPRLARQRCSKHRCG